MGCGDNFSTVDNNLEEVVNGVVYSDALAEEDAVERNINPRPQEIKSEINERGAFIRQVNRFTTPFGDEEGDLKAEAGKYHLFWAKGCHWSNRASIVRELLGLDDVISVSIVDHTGVSNVYGWGFTDQPDRKDATTGLKFLAEAYKNADPEYKGRATVPSLVDKTANQVVNNDYHRLTNYLEVNFRKFQPADAPDLYPVALRTEIDRLNDWLFPNINNAHYRMAFCQSLIAYNEAYDDFFNAMDKLEQRLENQRFLFGDYVTDADIRFFVTLARWDSYYYKNLGPQKKRMTEYKNIWAYARDLYEIPAFKNNCYFRDFSRVPSKPGIFKSYNERFNDQIDYEALWSAPQNRKVLSRTPDEKFLRHPAGEKVEDYITKVQPSRWNVPGTDQ